MYVAVCLNLALSRNSHDYVCVLLNDVLYQYNVVCVVWSSHFVLMIGDNMNLPCY